jgi:hypothetical protein
MYSARSLPTDDTAAENGKITIVRPTTTRAPALFCFIAAKAVLTAGGATTSATPITMFSAA